MNIKYTPIQVVIVLFIAVLITSCKSKQITDVTVSSNPYNPVAKMDLLKQKNGKNTTKMHFLVFGDSKGRSPFKDVLKRADLLQPEFCLTTADLVNKGAGEQGKIDYAQLDKDGGWFMKKYPMWPTVGNHEEAGGNDGLDNYINFFGMKKAMYSFEYGNAKFIALPWPKIKDDQPKLDWLESELKSANGKHIFIFKHRPHYDVGSKKYEDVEGVPTSVTKLYDKYKVTAVFSGHDHIYYRTKRNYTNYIISAGAGAPIYALKREKDAIKGDVYYGKRLYKEVKDGAVPYKSVDAKGKVTDIAEEMYYVLSVMIDGDRISIEMIDALTGKVWDKAVITNEFNAESTLDTTEVEDMEEEITTTPTANPRKNTILIAAHRGGYEKDFEDKAPENSMANIQNAINQGFELYESDVQRTKDGKFVIMHDKTIDRTTNGTGEVSAMTYDELKKVNLKYSNGEVSTEKIPLLVDFVAAGKGKVLFKIDFKPSIDYLDDLLEEIKTANLQGDVILRFKYKRATAAKVAKYDVNEIPTILFRLKKLAAYKELLSVYYPKMISIWEKKEFSAEHKKIMELASNANITIEAHTFRGKKSVREDLWTEQLKYPITIFHTKYPKEFSKFLKNKNLR